MKFCFVDLETTGVDLAKNGVLQISGMIRVSPSGAGQVFNFKVQPFATDVIDDEAMKISGLNPKEGDSPKEVHDQLVQILGQYVDKYDKRDKFFFVGYNSSFDNQFLRRFFEKCGDKYFGSWFWFPDIDVMRMAAVALADSRPNMINFKLATVARALGIEFDPMKAHDATYDLEKTVEMFDKLWKDKNTSPGSV